MTTGMLGRQSWPISFYFSPANIYLPPGLAYYSAYDDTHYARNRPVEGSGGREGIYSSVSSAGKLCHSPLSPEIFQMAGQKIKNHLLKRALLPREGARFIAAAIGEHMARRVPLLPSRANSKVIDPISELEKLAKEALPLWANDIYLTLLRPTAQRQPVERYIAKAGPPAILRFIDAYQVLERALESIALPGNEAAHHRATEALVQAGNVLFKGVR